TKCNYYELRKKDIILFNSNDMHQIETIDDSTVCRILISYKVLSGAIQNGNYIFYCNSVLDKMNSYTQLQKIMKRIVFSYLGQEHKTECLRYGLAYELLDNLVEHFQKGDYYFKYKKGNEEDEQLQYIINYVNLNFQNGIHLSDLADEMYTSKSTLSRFIKKKLGIYFSELVNEVRLNYAVRDLIETDKTITKISIDCGFSNASTFSKVFQNKYNLSPTLYRKQEIDKKKSSEEVVEDDIKTTKQEISLFYEEEEGKKVSSKEVDIIISAGRGKEYKRSWDNILNAGAAYNLIFANEQSHITYLVEQLKFKYVRIWNLFSDKLMIQKNTHDYNYNFNLIDVILDFLVNNNVKPFIDFGKRPNCAVNTEGETIYYEEEYIEFNNMKEWNNMFEKFISHIIKRYGKNEVETWKFEFSLDVRPDSFYIKDCEQNYDELFENSYKHIKKHIPKAEVGGFGVVMEINYDELLDWMTYCNEKDCIPDFVSILSFPYFQVEKNEKFYPKRVTNHSAVVNQVKSVRNILDKDGFEKCKLYVTECNNSLSNRNYLNDSCFRASYVINMIDELWDIPDMMGMWMGSDLVSSYYDTSKIVTGGSGLITKDKIRKPVFYSLLFLNKLGNRFIQKGKNYIVTTNGMNSYYILCFNYKEYSYDYYMKDENTMDISRLSNLFDNDDDLKVNIELRGMPENQKFIIKRHIVNKEHGSILNEWSKFQFEKDIEGSDLKHLSEVCIPDLTMEKQVAKDSILRISPILKSHEISMIHIYEDN
ncbi:MAG TPA: hypothetical protein DG753_10950, partial [Clostridium sp.]|nr:hypothetical protein [Clostridium sp.]